MAAPALAQVQALAESKLEKPTAPWVGTRNYISKVFGRADTQVTLEGPVRLRDYVLNGKLELSLKAYLDLVLANNTDLALQRLTLLTPMNAIQRAFSIFDPTLTASFSAARSLTPATNTLVGAAVLSSLSQPFSVQVSENVFTGGSVYSSFNMAKYSSNNSFYLYNPSYSGQLQFGFSQPLLRRRGAYITRLPITIARVQKKTADLNYESYLMGYVARAENAYWDVIAARENIKVLEQALALADESLKRARQEIQLGATSELEIFQPEQNYATAKINLTQAQYQLTAVEDVLRRFIGADLDPEVRKLPVVLTEKVETNLDETPFDREALVTAAGERRPDLKVQRVQVESADLTIAQDLDNLKPQLTLNGSYSTYGRGGPTYVTAPDGTSVFVPGGIGGAYGMLFGFGYPTYQMGLSLNFPMKDRNAAANLADAMVNKKTQVLQVRQAEQQVRQDVLTAITNVERSRASVQLAKVVVDYSVKRAEADKKRYDLGTITLFFLLSSQSDLTTAQSLLVNNMVQHRRNVLALQQSLGTLLDEKGIVVQ